MDTPKTQIQSPTSSSTPTAIILDLLPSRSLRLSQTLSFWSFYQLLHTILIIMLQPGESNMTWLICFTAPSPIAPITCIIRQACCHKAPLYKTPVPLLPVLMKEKSIPAGAWTSSVFTPSLHNLEPMPGRTSHISLRYLAKSGSNSYNTRHGLRILGLVSIFRSLGPKANQMAG